jgi:hypothetical protein
MSGPATARGPKLSRGGITPRVNVRVPPELITAARANNPEIADKEISVLIRIGLALLAGFTVKSALDNLGQSRGSKLPNMPDTGP